MLQNTSLVCNYSLTLLLSLNFSKAVTDKIGTDTSCSFPDSLGDELIVEVQDSKGKHLGRVLVQVAAAAEDLTDKMRWWSIYHEPEHEPVGKLQLYIHYSTSDDNSHLKVN
ncbi:Detected protein of unknown function [Hibiscus syriacus]|uniref:Uncharacterized protein n=1 Tax=Hibiscus syriacus TaxID=106335 RepID=A0A6A2ZGD6_HIBSY|nr:Detected protein of unknown function [Hibiscus syriacus]